MATLFGTDAFTVGANANLDAYPATPDYAYNLGSGSQLQVNAANDRVQQTAGAVDLIARVINPAVNTNGADTISVLALSSGSGDDAANTAVRLRPSGGNGGYIA